MKTRFTFFILSFLFLTSTVISQVPQAERDALIALYNSTDGPNWTNSNNWNTATTVDIWYGVVVADGHVTKLQFWSNQLSGTIPPELGNLTNLDTLDFWENQLTGSIPPELGNLSNLKQLVLEENQLTGSIPPELGNLSSLTDLNLYENQFTGSIPTELSTITNLKNLYLNRNQLSGAIPPELGNLSELINLGLSKNQLSGAIPPELGNLSELTYLSLGENQLTGSIPQQLGNLSNLFYIDLNDNQLSGIIPSEIGNLLLLEHLWLFGNQFSGVIPAEIGNLTNLKFLFLEGNQLSGTIPPEIGNLENLEYLWLGINQLTGTIPNEIWNLTKLIDLQFFDNQLTGIIPLDILDLNLLKILYISNNQFTGLPDLSSLPELTWFTGIDYNHFTFEDIEPNVGITGIIYTPQYQIPGPDPITLVEGDELNITIPAGGSANLYQWFKDSVAIDGASTDNLVISNVTSADIGSYQLEITSPLVPDLILSSEVIIVDVLVGIKDESLNNAFIIYPIPMSDQLNIETKNLPVGEYTLSIVDLSGRIMMNELPIAIGIKINNSSLDYKVDVNALPAGIYMVIIQNKDNQFIQKVMKE
ncbi:MAG: hypothetical protein DRI54_01745 [Bacteroidetes bacterium]|nr:MAG: hypothetical protein DRI54_01745 [Bacteroidota bacterium]